MARKLHRQKRKEALLSYENFNKALTNLLEISQIAIDRKIENTISKIDFTTIITANDKEFAPLLKQHCNKSGKELREFSLEHLQELVNLYGKEETLKMLRQDAVTQYAPLWIHTEPAHLNKLMAYDPAGYFVYSTGFIFHSEIVQKSNISIMPPHSQAGKESTENQDIEDFLSDFPQQDKPEDFLLTDLPESCEVRYFNLQDKIIARRNIELYHDVNKITECNELLRRFLGLAKPEKIANFIDFSFEYLYQITDSPENLQIFINDLKAGIKTLFQKHYKHLQKKNSYLYRTQITSTDIASIKAKYGGYSTFHKQPKIRHHTTKDSILYDLRAFWDENALTDTTLQSLRGIGNSANFDPNAIGLDSVTGEALNRHTVKTGFKLKIKKPE